MDDLDEKASLSSFSQQSTGSNQAGGSNQSLEGRSALKYIPSSVNVGSPSSKSREVLDVAKKPQLADTEQYTNPADLCCVSMFCATHRCLALVELDHNNKGLFLPCEQFNSSTVTIDVVLNTVIRKVVDTHSVKFRNLIIASIDRVQLPKKETFITHYIYRVEAVNGSSVTGNSVHGHLSSWLSLAKLSDDAR